jgi:pimeloyl-ACP methyl ester carboxylesterase
MKPSIVFIHGMFQNDKSWDNWKTYFEQKGFNCVIPSWPFHEGEPADLRNNPPQELGDLTLEEVIESIEGEVMRAGGDNTDPEQRPILIGHSVGGLLTQIFVNQGLASLGVCISPVAPNMMMTIDWPFFKNVATITNPFKGDKPFLQTPESFHESFCNTLNEQQARQAFEATALHDSRNVLRGCLGSNGHVDLDVPHVPMLFVCGKEDQIIPYELVEKNAKAYSDEVSTCSYQVFDGRSHYICNEPGWEQVAETIYDWIENNTPVETHFNDKMEY